MKRIAITLAALLSISLTAPAAAIDAEFAKVSDYQNGFDPTSNGSRGGPGARIATNSDGSLVFYSDFRNFNDYAFSGFPNTNGTLYGPKLYLSTDGGETVSPLASAPEANWGPVEISEDGQVLVAAPWRSYIANNQTVTDSGVWLSTDGGQSFTKQSSGTPSASNWDLGMDSRGEVIISTQDAGGYKPKFIDLAAASPSWADLPVSAGAWRSVSLNSDASVIALCEQSTGIHISRDRAQSFTLEIANASGEGCGPMELSEDGNTLVIGRFAHPDKKVFKHDGTSWNQVAVITGVGGWFSTASVSTSANGDVITIGDYLSGKLHLSFDAGATFETMDFSQDFQLSGEAYVSPNGEKIFSFNADGLYLMDLSPAEVVPTPVDYLGPVLKVTGLDIEAGSTAEISGENLESIESVAIGEQETEFETSSNRLSVKIPENIAPGRYDLNITSSFGKLRVSGALAIRAAELEEIRLVQTSEGWKIYHMNPVGLGKIQILVDGQEVFWLRSESDAASEKLRAMPDGTSYLVRSLRTAARGSVVEVIVEGQSVFEQLIID